MATSRKISGANVTKRKKITLPAGHPDLLYFDPADVNIIGEVGEYSLISKSIPAGNDFFRSGATDFAITVPETAVTNKIEIKKQEISDVPNLSDIESVTYEKYFDPVTKVEKAKAIIKVRNSNKNKNSVFGVDARIYQPRGI